MQPSRYTESPSRQLILQAIALSLGAAVALGFARFNYALLLPAMRADLAWTYAQAGSMNTANALGYLIGALSVAPIVRRVGMARCFWVSLLLIGLSLLGTGLTSNFTLLLIFRLLAGLSSATTFISGATLASHLAKSGHGGLVLGLYFGGVGIGIFLAGLGLPQLLEWNVEWWRYAWAAMGILTLVAVLIARPIATQIPTTPTTASKPHRWRFPTELSLAIAAYFLFGLGYISYMTFVIAFLRSGGLSTWALSAFWLLLGGCTFASAFVWQGLLDRAKGGHALATVLIVVAFGATLPLVSISVASVLVSAILFGGAFLSVVSAITNIVRCSLPARAWASGIALVTVIFSIGQTLGPLISGILTDRTSAFTSGFAFSAVCLFMGALLAYFQKPVQPEP